MKEKNSLEHCVELSSFFKLSFSVYFRFRRKNFLSNQRSSMFCPIPPSRVPTQHTKKGISTDLFEPSCGVPPDGLTSGNRSGQCPLLYLNVSAALDGKEDEAPQQGVSHEKGAYPEVYNKPLEEGVLAGLVRHSAEAEAPHLSRGMALGSVRRGPLQGRRIPIVRGLEALVSPVMPRVVLLHPRVSLSTSPVVLSSRSHLSNAISAQPVAHICQFSVARTDDGGRKIGR